MLQLRKWLSERNPNNLSPFGCSHGAWLHSPVQLTLHMEPRIACSCESSHDPRPPHPTHNKKRTRTKEQRNKQQATNDKQQQQPKKKNIKQKQKPKRENKKNENHETQNYSVSTYTVFLYFSRNRLPAGTRPPAARGSKTASSARAATRPRGVLVLFAFVMFDVL